MLKDWIASAFTRDLRALRREIEAYADERDLWRVAPGITNAAGTLALHLAGNIRYYVGTRLGDTGYVRDRDAEFAQRDVPRAELLRAIDSALAAVERGMGGVEERALDLPYPEPIAGLTLSTGAFLVHLVAHFTYHLGQVDYHRRLLTGQSTQIGAVAIREIASPPAPAASPGLGGPSSRS